MKTALDLKIVSPAEQQRESLYERLHREAEIKVALIKRARAMKDSMELSRCTFKPEIGKSTKSLKQPVFER
jgi:hypothetical protein